MAGIVREGQIVQVHRQPTAMMGGSLMLNQGLVEDYAMIYRTQPNVQICVGFLGRNIGQMAIHTFRRVSDNDRVRLTGHELDATLEMPSPRTSGFRFRDSLVRDLGIWGNSLWLKVKPTVPIPGRRMFLVRIPWRMVQVGDPDNPNENWLAPSMYLIRGNRGFLRVTPDQVVHFRFYNPDSEQLGVSPLESLRQILAEERSAGDYREALWRNGARINGIIKRSSKKPWSDGARNRFKEEWREKWSGDDAGGTPILEDDMDWIATSFDAQASQFIESRKLTREESAAAYFIAPPMVGILDHATFSNIDEQHKMTYQDTLGPYLKMITDDVDLQLLPDFDDIVSVYTEFNIWEKMKGSFEEQAAALAALTGTPILAVNEGRGRLNLNRIDDPAFDVPVKPMNVLFGGGSPPPALPPAPPAALPAVGDTTPKAARPDGRKAFGRIPADLVEVHRAKHREVLSGFFRRQGEAMKARAGAKKRGQKLLLVDDIWDDERWDAELHSDLWSLAASTAQDFGTVVALHYGGTYNVEGSDQWSSGLPFLGENARIAAEETNASTKRSVSDALADAEPIAALIALFAIAQTSRADQMAAERVTGAGNFGQVEAGKSLGRPGKVWITTSTNPRPSHASMDGETVDLFHAFSNGAQWPGDPHLPAQEVAGCRCMVDIA